MITPRVNTVKSDRPRRCQHLTGSAQSTASRLAATSASLARVNGLLPKKPLRADRGDGCAEQIVTCRDVSMSSHFFRASSPQRMNTTRSVFPLTTRMTSSGERLPPLATVGAWQTRAHRQRRVEQQHSVARPGLEVPVVGDRHTHVIVQLPMDVHQRWRHLYAVTDGEASAFAC